MNANSAAFLRQAHRNNWAQYLRSQEPDAQLGWDLCVLTASDEKQAYMYRRQLDSRRESGLLPQRTQFLVIPDPAGQRIGSGGATLRALQKVSADAAKAGQSDVFSTSRVLIIHSGGDSKRLPHCSATGKLFARLPRELPDGRATTLFDEFLISLSGLSEQLQPGVLVASGDVLLIFDHLQLQFLRPGVIGVAAAAPVEMGEQHGVYVTDSGRRIRAYLHKPSRAQMERWDAIDAEGQVPIDTGLVWLDPPAVEKAMALTAHPELTRVGLNLYGDLLLPMAGSTSLESYLADTSDGAATPELQAARQVIWAALRGTPFTVERLQPAEFVHFGTTQEYWELNVAEHELADLCEWDKSAASWACQGAQAQPGVVIVNSSLESSVGSITGPLLAVDSIIEGPLTCEGPALLANVQTKAPLRIKPGMVVHQLPVQGGFVTRVYGSHDNPKLVMDAPGATFANYSWAAWLVEMGLAPEALWPDVPAAERTLWNAQLYPVGASREESMALSLPLQGASEPWEGWREQWRASRRLSLAAGFALADADQIVADQAGLEDRISGKRFLSAIEQERPAQEAQGFLGTHEKTRERRCGLVASWLERADPLLQLRGYKALEAASGDRAWEDKAFGILAATIAQATPRRTAKLTDFAHVSLPNSTARVEAAARIDFGGGWTDTPPYSIERGGTVLNAAITLNGSLPIVAEAHWLAEPRLVLGCKDIDASLEPTTAGEVLVYANPADPFALDKAALVMRGLVPGNCDPRMPITELARSWGGGLRLHTETNIPRGSGLGTSSILAGAVLACLSKLLNQRLAQETLFDEVLCVEQMMTTGGGWQDQVGGLVGGIKLVTSEPGLPQRVKVEPVSLSPETERELAERLVLIYTGQQRLAKNLLQRVMGRWMARDPEMVWIQGEIARLAVAMRDALMAGDVEEFGRFVGEHWELNKRMNPACTNPLLDEIIASLQGYLEGSKLAGAGGGGFLIGVTRDDKTAVLRADLGERGARIGATLWDCRLARGAWLL